MKRLLGVILGVLLSFVSSVPVYAIAPPDVGPTLISATMYENVFALGDRYLIAKYSMDYTVDPADPIDVTFLGRLLGTVDMGVVSPYAHVDLGYSRGVFAMYWGPADANLPVWGNTTYTLRLEGNPTANWTVLPTPATLSSASFTWRTTSTIAETSSIMGTDIVAIANELGSYWSISLLTPTGTGGVNNLVFTASGEAYFSNALPGLRAVVPQIFSVSSVPATYVDSVHPQTHATTLTGRRASLGLYEGTVGGVSTDVIYALMALIISIILAAVVAGSLARFGGAVATMGGGVVGVGLSLGFIPLLFVYIGMLSAVVYGIVAIIAIIAVGTWATKQTGTVM